MPEISVKCKDVRNALIQSAMSSASEDRMLTGLEAHIQTCKPCRLYAEGLHTAPLIFGGESPYVPALKHRCLTAAAGLSGSGDLKLGLLVGAPAALSLLVSFFLQVYLVHLTLAKAVGADLFAWVISVGSVWTVGVAAGAVCLSALIRERMRSNRLQEVFHD